MHSNNMNVKTIETFPFSLQTGELEPVIKSLTGKYLELWWQADTTPISFFNTYSRQEQKFTETKLSAFIEKALDYQEPNAAPGTAAPGMKSFFAEMFTLFGLDVEDALFDAFILSTHGFINKIKKFDPAMQPEDIYQALRNVWIMNTLQSYFGIKIACTGSVFAYSMLYPYTDNLVDNASLSLENKLRFCFNLKQRLEGIPYSKLEEVEKKIHRLVTLVEGEFPTETFPTVFQSLRGIYNAQLKSLIQQRGPFPPYVTDIPGISFEKGGTSVLADGYLVNGRLDRKQQEFCFGFGTFLQLADDIQDIDADKKRNHMTLFSQVAGKYPLDTLANKLFHYVDGFIQSGMTSPHAARLKDAMRRSFQIHIIEAVGKSSELYGNAYVKELESHFPVRFSFLKKLRKKLRKVSNRQKKSGINLDTLSVGLMALYSRVYE